MYLCTSCGVELEDDLKVCPLCGKSTGDPGGDVNAAGSYPSDIILLYRKESREHFWELSGIIAFSGIIVCTVVDLLIIKGLKWSLFADVSIFAAWLLITLFKFTSHRPIVLITSLLAASLLMLFLFDLFTPGGNWFLLMGLPLALAAYLSVSIAFLLYRIAHFKGFNIIAVSLLVTSAFCVVSEIFIDSYLNNNVDLHWSLIEAVSVFPVALLCFFIHYRLKKGRQLDSFFHI